MYNFSNADVNTHSNAAYVILLFLMTTETGAIPFKISSGVTSSKVLVTTNCVPTLRTDQPVPISMTSLDHKVYSLVQSVVIGLQESDGEYVASFPEAEMVTSGDTPKEAVEWLKSSIISTFELLSAKRAVLGPLPKRQLQALERYIVKKQIRAA